MRVFLIAGEVSGDRLGAAVMAGLKDQAPDVTFDGIGGPLMESQGLRSRFPMSDLSLMGLAEILPRYLHLRRRLAETVEAVLATRPDILLTIDSPDFGLRVAKQVRARAPRIRNVHYVAPSVWAWRPGRAARMAPHVDQVLALLPFEPPLMQAAGIACDFVGHPVVTEPLASAEDAAAFRAAHDIQGPLILALPGSRWGEVTRLADRFGQALALVVDQHRDARIALPMAAPVAGLVRELTASWRVKPILLDRDDLKRAAFRGADVALAASGTVSLELAANATPMVIGYDMAWASRQIIARMLLTDTVTLVNLVSETRAVPEFIGKDCQPGPMAGALLQVLNDSQAQLAAMDLTMERLGRGAAPAGQRAAAAILARLLPA